MNKDYFIAITCLIVVVSVCPTFVVVFQIEVYFGKNNDNNVFAIVLNMSTRVNNLEIEKKVNMDSNRNE